MTTTNVCIPKSRRADLCTGPNMDKPVIFGIQETLVNTSKRRLWIPGYTTIEANMINENESRGIVFAIRKGTGLSLNEFRNDRDFVAESIEGLTEEGQLSAIMTLSV